MKIEDLKVNEVVVVHNQSLGRVNVRGMVTGTYTVESDGQPIGVDVLVFPGEGRPPLESERHHFEHRRYDPTLTIHQGVVSGGWNKSVMEVTEEMVSNYSKFVWGDNPDG